MDVVQTITNGAVVAAVGIVLAWMMTGFRRELRDDMANMRTEVREDIGSLRAEIGRMRSDLTQVALSVGVRPRAENE